MRYAVRVDLEVPEGFEEAQDLFNLHQTLEQVAANFLMDYVRKMMSMHAASEEVRRGKKA